MTDAAGAQRAGLVELNDGADEAEARHHLLLGIITCGIPQPMAEKFMDEQGIASARELSMLSDEEVESAVKMHNHSITMGRVRELKLGIGHVKKIKALKYHAAVLRMQGREFVSDDWTRETVASTIAIMAAEVDEADTKAFNAGPIKDGTDWPQWESNYFVELCGVKGTFTRAVGLAPFARDDSRKDDPILTEIEREVFSIRLEGPEYDRGNPIFFWHFQNKVKGTSHEVVIAPFVAAQDGRSAFLAVRAHQNGVDQVHKRIAAAKRVIDPVNGIQYNGEYERPLFDEYCTTLSKNFRILEVNKEGMSVRSRCDRLNWRMHVGNNEQMKFALFTAKERFREDWVKAIVYLADAVADVYPRKNAHNQRKRPQDGPSGYRKVSKANQNYDEPVIINGVDCSTDLWNFTDDDWKKMGKEGNNWVQSQRDRIKARQANGGRGVVATAVAVAEAEDAVVADHPTPEV
jgi:hypothetical protein